jgi:general secretion pathway protein F/type IV pilus assembly protein PilC
VPLAHAPLSLFYRQLAQQLAAGLTFAQSIRAPSPAPAAERRRLGDLAEAGASMDHIVASAGAWLPAADRPLLTAAASAGRLPLVLAHLADHHAELAATRRRVLVASAYPVFVFHLGALVFPFVRMIDFERGLCGGVETYLAGLALILVPAWGLVFLGSLLLKRDNPVAHGVLDALPAIGGYRRQRALSDFAFTLGTLLEAGAPIGEAWRRAGESSRAPRLRRAARDIAAAVEGGLAPGSLLAGTGVFPVEFVHRYITGETTGGLEQSLLALAADHQERAKGRLAAATALYPALLFAGVVAMIGYLVIGFVLKYVNTLNTLMQ